MRFDGSNVGNVTYCIFCNLISAKEPPQIAERVRPKTYHHARCNVTFIVEHDAIVRWWHGERGRVHEAAREWAQQ